MALIDRIKRDSQKVFLQPGHFRESVIYRPGGVVDNQRPIWVNIDRTPPKQLEPGKKGSAYQFVIKADNDPVTGIAAATFDVSVDTVLIPMKGPGSATVERHFSKDVFNVDQGMINVSVV